jgi:hypothetical protein
MGAITDLEVWFIGTGPDVAATTITLAALGHLVESRSQQLAGDDAGHARRYLRVAVNIAQPGPCHRPAPARSTASVLDIVA